MHRNSLSTLLLLAIPFALCAGEAAPEGREPMRLTLKRAVEIATSPEGNTYIQLSDENLKQVKSRSAEARSALLPDIEAQAGQNTAMRSLAALGLDLATNQTLLGAENGLTGALAPRLKKTCWTTSSKHSARGGTVQLSGRARAARRKASSTLSNIKRYQASRAAVRASHARPRQHR